MRVCSTPGCPTIHEGTDSRCPTHSHTAKQAHWNKTRAYSSKGHRLFRAAILRREPICTLCGLRESTIADHHPKSRADLLALHLNANDPQYGRGLCKKCHDTQTAHHQPGGWNAR